LMMMEALVGTRPGNLVVVLPLMMVFRDMAALVVEWRGRREMIAESKAQPVLAARMVVEGAWGETWLPVAGVTDALIGQAERRMHQPAV
jgi:hypothetical protein